MNIRKKNFSDFPNDAKDDAPKKVMTIDKRYQMAKAMQNPTQNEELDVVSDSDGDSCLSKSYSEMHGNKNKIEIQNKVEMEAQRAKIQRFSKNEAFKFCVYQGNFP